MSARTRKSARAQVVLGGLLLLAVALIMRLMWASVMPKGDEEFLMLNQPPDTGFIDYLVRIHGIAPEHLPTFYVYVYALRLIFGYSWMVPRIASMVIGLLVVLLTAGIAYRRFGARAAFMAGMLMALSPADIYHAATWRSYTMQIFVGAASMWALLRARETGQRRWWVANVALNTFCVWLHLWGVLVCGAQGLWLLYEGFAERPKSEPLQTRCWKALPPVLKWTAAHALVFVAVAGYWLSGTVSGVKWYMPPRWDYFITDLLGDAFLHGNLFTYDSMESAGYYADYAGMAMRTNLDYWASFSADFLLGALVLLGLALAGLRLFRGRDDENSRGPQLGRWLFAGAFVPPLMLYVMSVLLFPCGISRYTAFCNVYLFIFIGIGLGQLKRRWLGNLLFAAVCVLFFYEAQMWMRVAPEPDWPAVAEMAARRPHPEDEVILVGINGEGVCEKAPITTRLIENSTEGKSSHYRQAPSLDGAIDACAAQIAATGRPATLITRSMWHFKEDRDSVLSRLRQYGIDVHQKPYKDFVQYTISRREPISTWATPPGPLAAAFLAELRPYLDPNVPELEINAALRWAVWEQDGLDYLMDHWTTPLNLMEVSPRMALAAARLTAARNGEERSPALAIALAACGLPITPEQALYCENGLGPIVSRRLLRAICAGDSAESKTLGEEFRWAMGSIPSQGLMQLAGVETRLHYAAPFVESSK
jgi:hypothetical protein